MAVNRSRKVERGRGEVTVVLVGLAGKPARSTSRSRDAVFPGSRAVGVVPGRQIATRGLHEPASPLAFKAARRRQRRMARVDHDLSDEQWTTLQAAWGGCAYCGAMGVPLQRDCVLALSRGGRYTLDNIVPACRSCNTSKCNDEVTAWMRRKRLDERTFLLRYHQITASLTAP